MNGIDEWNGVMNGNIKDELCHVIYKFVFHFSI